MKLRPATLTDSLFLYTVRNDPEVRRWSRNQEAFSRAQHEAWLVAAFDDPQLQLFMIETGESESLGYVKLVKHSETSTEVGLGVAPAHQHAGVGTEALRLVVDGAARRACGLTAIVRGDNAASLIAFFRNGFEVWMLDRSGVRQGIWVHLVRHVTQADAPRICDGCRAGWPHRRHPLDRISSRWASEAERDADMATWPVLYDLHEEPCGEGQVLVHECTAAKLFDRSLA